MILNEQEQSLLKYFRNLSPQDQHTLLRFAGFLATSEQLDSIPSPDTTETQSVEPQLTPRPEGERVVDALKRLSNAYPMLEKKKLLDKTSGLVAQHIIFGKPAKGVIDQIEKVFADAYAEYLKENGQG